MNTYNFLKHSLICISVCVIFQIISETPVHGALKTNYTKILLVDFGCSEQSSKTPYKDWHEIIRNKDHTYFAKPDNNANHCGITESSKSIRHKSAYFGIKGNTPIHFKYGQKIVVTVYKRGEPYEKAMGRISFSDSNSPKGATWDTTWNTLYEESIDPEIRKDPKLTQLTFNITSKKNIANPKALPTEGFHNLVNVALTYSNSSPGKMIVTKIELLDNADITPPLPPVNLEASMVTVSTEAGDSMVQLSWGQAVDPKGKNDSATGISRYFIYRDNKLHDLVSKEWKKHWKKKVKYYDLTAREDKTYVYSVTAVDKAVTGYYKTRKNMDASFGNESRKATIQIKTPPKKLGTLINPDTDFKYLGAFTLPKDGDWEYAGSGLTFYPDGNPNYDPKTELPGSLYGIGHDHRLKIAEISIPKPIIANHSKKLNRAKTLKKHTHIWPKVYNGSWLPGGSVGNRAGIGYHPAVNGVPEGIYYGLYRLYSTDLKAPAHGVFNMNLTKATGAWYVGGRPNSPRHVPPTLTARFVFAAPLKWAEKYTQGRSLIYGLGWPISGHGFPSCGPSLFAIAPWEKGQLPKNKQFVSTTKLLKYGSTGQISRWAYNWTPQSSYDDAVWIHSKKKQAVVFIGSRVVGDYWYGTNDGSSTKTTDWDLPLTRKGKRRGWQATGSKRILYFYNPKDLERVVNKLIPSWQPQPYAALDLFEFSKNKFTLGSNLAFDAKNGYMFILKRNGEDNSQRAIISVWKVEQS